MTELVAVDIGGTHARFALAQLDGGHVATLGEPAVFRTAGFASLPAAWIAFEERLGRRAPRAAAIGLACPIGGEELRLTNNDWVIRPADLRDQLGVDRLSLVNDFAAIAHAVTHAGPDQLRPLCGPVAPLPTRGTISIVGPGTGLGVAALVRRENWDEVLPTEGGHMGFAPLDAFEDALLARLRRRHGRVSAERVASGPALGDIYALIDGAKGRSDDVNDRTLWDRALAEEDGPAAAALDRFCKLLGSVAGDVALAHGAGAVVIAGGLGLRLARRLPTSGFGERFRAKGRFAPLMARLPVSLLTHEQPGLLGAAACFAQEHLTAFSKGREHA